MLAGREVEGINSKVGSEGEQKSPSSSLSWSVSGQYFLQFFPFCRYPPDFRSLFSSVLVSSILRIKMSASTVLVLAALVSVALAAVPSGRNQGIFGPMTPEQIEKLLSDRSYVQKQLGCVLGKGSCDQTGNQLRGKYTLDFIVHLHFITFSYCARFHDMNSFVYLYKSYTRKRPPQFIF